nr:CCR4-NOT transcription complex subunit 6-like isoform X2 [Ciona intestinalis]|eukprot:XP_018672587.1 CCR4-NOT transcription complex subunit 6-like isoform X2 [Ciona intestinalis]
MPKEENTKHRNGRRNTLIMSQEEAKSGKPSHWDKLEITGTIRNLSPAIWQLRHLTALFLNDNQLSRIPPDICKLENLIVLDLSCNKLRSLPAEIGDLIKLRELMLNHNSLRVLPYEIGKLFQLQMLGLVGNPLQQDIANLYKNGVARLLTYLLDNLAVTSQEPPERDWIHTANPDRCQPMAIFSVMSYNVLCDKYATRQLYGYCPPWALSWEYRRKIILREITYYSADILALQEVETCEYHNFFLPELKLQGYDGIFNPKSRAKHMADEDKQHVDGCAIFWRTQKLSLVKEHLVEFNQVAMQNNEGSEDMLNRVMTKDNIGIAALLETNDGLYDNSGFRGSSESPKQHILAVNAHMHWDPEFSDVKLIQTVMLCHEVKRICDEANQSFRPGGRTTQSSDCHKMPLVLCGDFNSLPDSGVVEFLRNGKVSSTHCDFKEIKYSKCLSTFGLGLRSNGTMQDPKSVTHPFRLNSCYDDTNFHLLQYSNNTYEFKGIIDYIFYSRTQMKCLGVLGGIDPEWFKQNNIVGCPHPHVPSDHIPVISECQVFPPGHQKSNYPPNNNYNHRQPYSQLFTHPTPPQPPQQPRYPPNNGGNRPGSSNSITHSPINLPNGRGSNGGHGVGVNRDERTKVVSPGTFPWVKRDLPTKGLSNFLIIILPYY